MPKDLECVKKCRDSAAIQTAAATVSLVAAWILAAMNPVAIALAYLVWVGAMAAIMDALANCIENCDDTSPLILA